MFWGLIMEPNKRYTQIVEKAFHVSMATLDVTTADEEIVQVMLCYENRNYLLCNLKSGSNCQSPLDLHFKEGTKIAFTSNGRGHVHLTGYLLPDDELDDLDEMEEEEEDEEEEEEVEVVPQLVAKQSKRKAQTSPTDKKSTKRLKALMEETVQASDENSDDDDDDDSEAEVEDASLGDDSEEDDDDEEEVEEEEDSDEDEEDEVEDITPQPKKNKQQQPQQKQQQQPQQPKQKNQKAEKQQNNLSNGKEAKSKQVVKEAQPTLNNSQTQKKKVLTGGIQIEDIKVGTGTPAKQGKFVSVYYIGRLKNGKKFDATTSGDGFKFRLGKGEVIKGWDIGVQGMKIGGKRRITIPPAMAYGAKGSPPVIPGNSTLTFEVELKNVH